MNNLKYDFENTGYKIHIPVAPYYVDGDLTCRVAEYLDQRFGTTEADRFKEYVFSNGSKECYSKYFKIGKCGSDLEDGKGITIYGKVGTADEMNALAKDIEAKFGKEIATFVQQNNIGSPSVDLRLTQNTSVRFAGYHFGVKSGSGTQNIFLDYNHALNPSGALTKSIYRDINGVMHESTPFEILNMADIDRKFLWGDSTLAMLDNFGELYTGKIENGKIPQFVMDGLPKEYLAKYNISEKDIITRINNGTKQIVANMLEDAVNDPKSKILRGNPPWFTTLDVKVIDEAKQLLAQYEPETVKKLEQMLPQLEKTCPAMAVLKNTTPFSKMTGLNPSPKPTSIGGQKPTVDTPKPTVDVPNPTVDTPDVKPNSWLDNIGTKGKVGIALSAVSLAALATYYIAKKGNFESEKVDKSEPQKVENPETSKIPIQQQVNPYTPNNVYNNTLVM